jgi:tetratricopeptide (TPR) repeat protein
LSAKASPKERFWIQAYYYRQSETTYDKALETCLNWLRLYPEDTTAMIWVGTQYLFKEDYDQAVKFLDMSIRGGSVNPYSFLYLAEAYYLSGAYDKGRQTAELGLSTLPDNYIIFGALFDGLVSQGKFEEARLLIGKREANNPGLAVDPILVDLAIIEGKYGEAAGIFAKYKDMTSLTDDRLSLLKLAEGKIGQAIEIARSAKDHLSLAYLDYRAGSYEEALAETQSALQDAYEKGSFSERAWALQIRGLVELAMASIDAATKTASELETCAKESPIQRLIRHYDFLTGMIDREAGRYSESVGSIKKAIALLPRESWGRHNPWHSLFIDGLAGTYFKSGDLARAEEEYRKIQSLALGRLRYGDIFATSFYWLGRIAEKRGHRTEAGQRYREFLDIWKDADPGLLEVKDARKRLAGPRGT